MKHKDFYDQAHARAYLHGCVIRKAEAPILIQNLQKADRMGKKWRVDYNELGDMESNILFLPNRAIDMNPVPLGMLNGEEDGVWFVSRQATRKWKVGLYQGNMHSYGHGLSADFYRGPNINSSELNSCIRGLYPDYTAVMCRIRAGKKKTLAFSRRFCVDQGSLLFKALREPVGIAERVEPVLFDQFAYLKEVLEEDLNG